MYNEDKDLICSWSGQWFQILAHDATCAVVFMFAKWRD